MCIRSHVGLVASVLGTVAAYDMRVVALWCGVLYCRFANRKSAKRLVVACRGTKQERLPHAGDVWCLQKASSGEK